MYAILFLALQATWWAQSQQSVLIVEHSEPLSNLLFSKIQGLPNAKSLMQSLGFVLAFALAIMLNSTIVSNKIIPNRGYTTGAIFLILLSLFQNFAVLSPELIAIYFSLRILQKSLSIVKEEKPFGDIFDLGWLSALATLFYFPSIWQLLFSLFVLVLMRPFSLREWLMVLIGFIAPFFLTFAIYFWFDKWQNLAFEIINSINAKAFAFHFSTREMVAVITLIVLFLLSVTALPKILFSNVIQVRKFSNLLLLMLLLIVLSSFLQANFEVLHFSVLCLPLSILGAMYFQSLKGFFLSELLFGILLLSAIIVHFIK